MCQFGIQNFGFRTQVWSLSAAIKGTTAAAFHRHRHMSNQHADRTARFQVAYRQTARSAYGWSQVGQEVDLTGAQSVARFKKHRKQPRTRRPAASYLGHSSSIAPFLRVCSGQAADHYRTRLPKVTQLATGHSANIASLACTSPLTTGRVYFRLAYPAQT